MNTKNAFYGALCGALVFGVLSWVAPKKAVGAAVLASPPEGRFELVQLHKNASTEWSGILDTETGCTWVFTSQTPPTDAEVKAAPDVLKKSYQQRLGSQYFGIVEYDDNGEPPMTADQKPLLSDDEASFVTLATEEIFCAEARQNALRAAAGR